MMTDDVDRKRRSEIMRSVKSQNTKPELIVRRFLFSNGFRFRLHDNCLPGHPDIKLPKYNCLIFVNGCFWHGHKDCKNYRLPKTNVEFWSKKITKNIGRDERNAHFLKKLGWNIIVIWECELNNKVRHKTLQDLVEKLIRGKVQ